MPSRKQPQVKKETPPDATLLGRVTFPAGQEPPASKPTDGKTSALPPEPPEHTLRRSWFEQVDKQPENPTPYILLGWSSADARSAALYFQRALEIEPENPVARDGLEWALRQVGPAEAQRLLARETILPEAVTEPAQKPRPKARDFRWRTISRFYQIPFFRNLGIAVAYLLLISAAEVVTVLVNATFGIIFHATLMIGLIVHGSVLQQGPFRRYLVILALAPLIRLLSLSLPLAAFDIPIMYRYMIVGVPILLAAYFAGRSVGLTANRLYFTWKGWPLQLLFSLVGLLLGYFEYLILHPAALVPSAGWFDIAMGMFILIVFTGFLEEFIFRSLLQVTGIQLFGGIAIWIISILFGILHIGYYSAFDVVFAGSVGLLFGYFALRTQSLLGISLAHGITNITLYILLPLVLR